MLHFVDHKKHHPPLWRKYCRGQSRPCCRRIRVQSRSPFLQHPMVREEEVLACIVLREQACDPFDGARPVRVLLRAPRLLQGAWMDLLRDKLATTAPRRCKSTRSSRRLGFLSLPRACCDSSGATTTIIVRVPARLPLEEKLVPARGGKEENAYG